MMIEHRFGRIDKRELCLRWIVPLRFCEWSSESYDWRLSWKRRQGNHRCYCQEGMMFDGNILLAGWGLTWFYSNYTGEIPCWCDKAIEELAERDRNCPPTQIDALGESVRGKS
tara:strand:+ start:300 stop:638 length:339 start_codon:yes stop_codon:yes gene_type:complete